MTPYIFRWPLSAYMRKHTWAYSWSYTISYTYVSMRVNSVPTNRSTRAIIATHSFLHRAEINSRGWILNQWVQTCETCLLSAPQRSGWHTLRAASQRTFRGKDSLEEQYWDISLAVHWDQDITLSSFVLSNASCCFRGPWSRHTFCSVTCECKMALTLQKEFLSVMLACLL